MTLISMGSALVDRARSALSSTWTSDKIQPWVTLIAVCTATFLGTAVVERQWMAKVAALSVPHSSFQGHPTGSRDDADDTAALGNVLWTAVPWMVALLVKAGGHVQDVWHERCMIQLLNKYTKTLTRTDQIEAADSPGHSNPNDEFREDGQASRTQWRIPRPGCSAIGRKDRRTSHHRARLRTLPSDTCIICLQAYHLGDRVAWSSNPACVHAFHAACVQRWFQQSLKQQQPTQQQIQATYKVGCPCCRRTFLLSQRQ